MATSLEEAAGAPASSPPACARAPRLRAAHPALARPIAPCTRTSRTATSGGLLLARARYGWSGPDWGRWFYERGGGALFDLGVYNVTALCGLLGPAQRVTAMAGVAIPERIVEGELVRVAGRGQRARADRLRRGALRLGHDRLHDAAVPLTGDRAVRRATACCSCSATTGRRMATSSGATPEGAWELFPESDPGWQWTEGLRHLVECIETGREPVIAARARLSRARDHAGRAGGGGRRSSEGDRQRLPAPRARGRSRTRRTVAASTTRAPR